MGAQQELAYARDLRCSAQRPTSPGNKQDICSQLFPYKKMSVRIWCSFQSSVPVRGRGAGCDGDARCRRMLRTSILQRSEWSEHLSGTALCLHLYGACPNSCCFFTFEEYPWHFRIKKCLIMILHKNLTCKFQDAISVKLQRRRQLLWNIVIIIQKEHHVLGIFFPKDLYRGKLYVGTAVPVRMRHGLFITPAN